MLKQFAQKDKLAYKMTYEQWQCQNIHVSGLVGSNNPHESIIKVLCASFKRIIHVLVIKPQNVSITNTVIISSV